MDRYINISPSLLRLLPSLPIPPLQVVTKHEADLPVLCSCFPLAIYFTFGSGEVQTYRALWVTHKTSKSNYFTSLLKALQGFPLYNLSHFQYMATAYVSKFISYHSPLSIAFSTLGSLLSCQFLNLSNYFFPKVFSCMVPSVSNLCSAICMTHCIISLESLNIFLPFKVFPEHHFYNSTFTACHSLPPLACSK